MKDAIHGVALAVAVDPDGPLAGVLLLGPSGSGKSALALSAIERCPWRRTALVADDMIIVTLENGRVMARAPDRIKGLIEIRGYGPAPCRTVATTALVAAFRLGPDAPRLPEAEWRAICGEAKLPHWPFAPGGDGASRLRAVLKSIVGGQNP